jgi:hypothetical protein
MLPILFYSPANIRKPEYRRIIVRDYKILYNEKDLKAYIMNVVCTKAQ